MEEMAKVLVGGRFQVSGFRWQVVGLNFYSNSLLLLFIGLRHERYF
jgi:hypothetical protein